MKGTIPIKEAAKWLEMDVQTVRLWIRNGVDWGECLPGRGSNLIYIVYAKPFAEKTGYPLEYDPQREGASGEFCTILSDTIERFQALQTETDDSEVWRDCQRMIDSLDLELDAKRKGRFNYAEL